MDGIELLETLERRLGLHAIVDERLTTPVLLDALTETRDKIVRVFAQGAPVVVRATVTLTQGTPDTDYSFAADVVPLKVLEVRSVTGAIPLRPSLSTNDAGDYHFISPTTIRLSDGTSPPGGVEVVYIPAWRRIEQSTTEVNIGLPTPCHWAIIKGAVVEILSVDNESDIRLPLAQYQAEIMDLENMYGEFDALGGIAFREALMGSYGQWLGDTLY